jgi:hypothetical protein
MVYRYRSNPAHTLMTLNCAFADMKTRLLRWRIYGKLYRVSHRYFDKSPTYRHLNSLNFYKGLATQKSFKFKQLSVGKSG